MKRFALTLAALCSVAAAQTPAPFKFVALGDMPYQLPGDYARFERLIGVVNGVRPAFTLHVGDIKSGSTPCSDENFQKVLTEFAMFDGPLVYTPGDNEWTDCHRDAAGKFDPLERLAKVRAMFFASAQSFGRAPLRLERQADLTDHRQMVENARWRQNGVMFATVHVVGSNNGFERTPASVNEYFARDRANVEWIKDTFAKATAENAPAVVLTFQADLWYGAPILPTGSGFANTLAALAEGAAAYGKPVLLVHGDSHTLVVDQPLKNAKGQVLTNVTRLMVYGDSLVHAVEVSVNPADPAVFAFRPVIVPENR